MPPISRVRVIDSHTGGEPTRLVISGGPDLGAGSMAEQLERFRQKHDHFRSAVVNEPRGNDAMVGALLCAPQDHGNTAGVIFFNNVGYLGMCGHGTMGLIVSLAHLGRVQPGDHRIETPAGVVTATLHDNGYVSVRNVPAFRHLRSVAIQIPGHGPVHGDVAWGGNWFFLVSDHDQQLEYANIKTLTDFCDKIRSALAEANIQGTGGAAIDHVELFTHSDHTGVDSRNFVLCPGSAYDRSPCGTGTSAKLACLVSDGVLKPGDLWRQESIIGSLYEGSVEIVNEQVIPTITGRAWVMAEADLLLQPGDQFVNGIVV